VAEEKGLAAMITMPLGTEVGLSPRQYCVRSGPSPLPKRDHSRPTSFRPLSIVVKRSSISATAELLFYFYTQSLLVGWLRTYWSESMCLSHAGIVSEWLYL